MHTELLEKCLSEYHCEKCYSISFMAPGQVYWYNPQTFFSPGEQFQLCLLFLCVRHFSAYIIFLSVQWTCSVFCPPCPVEPRTGHSTEMAHQRPAEAKPPFPSPFFAVVHGCLLVDLSIRMPWSFAVAASSQLVEDSKLFTIKLE